MAKHRPSPMAFDDNTTEHAPGDPAYNRAVQDMIDQAQWVGRGIPCFPDKVRVHHLPADDEVTDVWKRDGEDNK